MKRNSISINKEFFIKNSKGDVTYFYEVIKKIGEGSYGKVYIVKNKTSQDIRAMKQLDKNKIKNPETFKNEVKILSMLDHPNIVRLFEVLEDEKYFYLIMEFCNGGDLLNRMENNHYKEKEAAILIDQLISAVSYCHQKGICHRDLKPGNILFANKQEDSPIKIIDFGVSTLLKPKSEILENEEHNFKRMKSSVGTVHFLSPEVIKGNYNESCDIWSCGVILYILLCGHTPFDGANNQEIIENIMKGKVEFPKNEWKNISSHAKELIKGMLSPEKTRITIKGIINSKWFKSKLKKQKNNTISFDLRKLAKFDQYNTFKKAVMIFIASRLKNEECNEIREIFNKINECRSGTISFDEFKNFLINEQDIEIIGGETDYEIKEHFLNIDLDQNKKIDYTEFIAANMDKKVYLKKEKLKEAFEAFDLDQSGFINKSEVANILKMDSLLDGEKLAAMIIKENDYNNDGKINFDEFCQMMN